MAAAGIRPGSEGADLTAQEWSEEIMTAPNEEGVIVKDVKVATATRSKGAMGEVLNISIIPIVTARELTTSQQGQGSDITYETASVSDIQVTPLFTYGIVELPDHLTNKLSDSREAATKAAYRKQLLAMLDTKKDVEVGELATGFLSQLGGPGNFDKAGLLSALGTLTTNAKEFVKLRKGGRPAAHLKYHPTQLQYLNAISEISNAYARGDGAGTSEVVMDAWNMTLEETGNIYVSAGVAYNLLFTPEAIVIGYNQKPIIKPEQEFEFVVRMPASQEFGVAELFDEACVVFRSPV
jgi:hypothetical protein